VKLASPIAASINPFQELRNAIRIEDMLCLSSGGFVLLGKAGKKKNALNKLSIAFRIYNSKG
jgi:hypothetical protein